MKPGSSRLLLAALLWATLAVPGVRAESARLFEIVPAGDPTYAGLKKLEAAGLLQTRALDGSLTRYDVAARLIEARQHRGEIVLAQVDLQSLPSLDEGAEIPTTVEQAQGVDSTLSSLEGAFQAELNDLQTSAKDLKERTGALEEAQTRTRRKILGIRNLPSVRLNGVGRVIVFDDRVTEPLASDPSAVNTLFACGYVDLMPRGSLGRDLQWGFLARVATALMPVENDPGDTLSLRRIWAEYSPSFLTIRVGDFDEAYTPLTLWNRSELDMKYRPDWWDRAVRLALYENHLDREPLVPLRGVRLGVEFDRPGSKILDRIEMSSFVHMVKSGFGNGAYGAGFTDWSVGGKSALRSKLGLSLEAYGLLYDQQLDSDSVTVVYDPNHSATWASQYQVGSLRPKLEREVWNGLVLGVQMETAFARYRADKYDSTRVLEDYAYLGGPFLQKGKTSLKFQYVEAGPSYYSPYAQQRQSDDLRDLSLFPYVQTLGQPGALYKFYDRVYDNVFPYGLATPNRRGWGLDLEARAWKGGAFKLSASAYRAKEIQRNLVVNGPLFTQLVPVEDSSNPELFLREFKYVNIGPRVEIGKLLGWEKPFEFGVNLRQEFTRNALGSLKTQGICPGVRLGLRSDWEFQAEGFFIRTRGREYGYIADFGTASERVTTVARYNYWYDPTDLGLYTPIDLNRRSKVVRVSSVIRLGKNSRLDVSGALVERQYATDPPVLYVRNQEVEVIYEVQF